MSTYWTKAERESRRRCTSSDPSDGHHSDDSTCPIHEGVDDIGIEEWTRILATVDALEKIARHFDDRDCDSHGEIPFPCDFCRAVTEPVLAALEAK